MNLSKDLDELSRRTPAKPVSVVIVVSEGADGETVVEELARFDARDVRVQRMTGTITAHVAARDLPSIAELKGVISLEADAPKRALG